MCVLCRRTQVNPDICGETFTSGGLCAHQFCLFFADGLLEWRTPMGGILGFSLHAVQRAVQLADKKYCFVCDERGATISCAETSCERSFHLPCAEDGECVTQYFGQHRSFCWEHRPGQAAEAAPSHNNICVICLEPVGDSTSYHTMMCPDCKQAWFHRGCIRKHALHAATMRFFCPVCGGRAQFRSKMTMLGIQIPVRRPSWWDDEEYQLLRERHRWCDARMCIYIGGRERAQEAGPWQLLLCSSCGSEGTHRYCTFWATNGNSWECNTCAGAGTASHLNSDLASPSAPSQMVLGPSHSTSGPENISSGPTSQAATGPSCTSHLPEPTVQPDVPAAEQGTTCPSLSAGQDTTQQFQGRRRRRRARAAGAETCSRSPTRQRTARSSRSSPAAARTKRPRQRGTGRTRSRYPLQGRASGSQSQPQRQRGRSRTRARGAQSRSRSSATPAALRSSRASPLPARRRQSRQRGRAHTRRRPPVGRRASSSRSRPRGVRGSRNRQRRTTRAQSRSRVQQHPHSQSQRRRRSGRVPSQRGCGSKRPRK
ncbi:PHD finger protein 7-like isoform X2 [Coturnix japonica]|uniref:PHD finger protein 7-like isoform X2 n=1 Tax=Coturnix japonica TaxID=93934 RepID=UPI000777397F|nr:PHD finger protein 7-like isoform X2 [Coturnix japonica]